MAPAPDGNASLGSGHANPIYREPLTVQRKERVNLFIGLFRVLNGVSS